MCYSNSTPLNLAATVLRISFLLAFTLVLLAVRAEAATRFWDGGGTTGFWDTAANWSNNVAPANGDALFFPTNAARLINTNRASANLTNFDSIRFTGENYNVFSVPSINLTNGLTNASSINTSNTLNAALQLRRNQTWGVGGRNSLTLNSNVNWTGFSLTNDLDGTLVCHGSLIGSGGAQLFKTGGGRLDLNGGANQIPTVRVIDGTLQVDGTLTVATSFVISNGASLTGTGSVSAFTCAGDFSPGNTSTPGLLTVTGAGNVVFNSGARFFANLNGLAPGTEHDQFRTPTPPNLSGATLLVLRSFSFPFSVGQRFVIITNTGATALTTTFTNLAQNARLTNSGVVFQISYTGGSGNDVELTVVDAPFVATGVTRVWDGGGANAFFSTSANWAGDVAPQDGDSILFPAGLFTPDNLATNDLIIRFNQLLCASSGGGMTLRGQPLFLGGGIIATQSSGALTVFNNVSFLNGGPIQTAAGNVALSGSVTNGGADLILTGGSGQVIFNGVLSGDGGLIVSSVGGAQLNNGNIYQGTTRLLLGPVTIAAPNALGQSTNGTFVGEDVNLTVASTRLFESSISLTGRISFPDTTTNITSEIAVHGTNASMLGFPGDTVSFVGPVTGDGPLLLSQGNFVFGNSHAVTGGITIVNRGSLRVNGTGSSDITIGLFDGTLGGTGAVGRVSVASTGRGRIEPGNSPGVLTTSNFVLNGTVTNVFELNGPVPGSGYDQLSAHGTVNLAGSRLQLSLGYTPAVGDTFVIIDNDGADAVTGTFAGLAEGALVNAGSNVVRLTYVGGTGNDVVLTAVEAPFIPTGVTRAWDGGAGGASRNWSITANWDGNIPPARGDSLVFPASAPSNTRINVHNLAVTNAVYGRIWFGGLGNTWIIQGNALKIFDGVVATNESGLGNASFGNASVELIGSQSWNCTNMNLAVNAPLLLGGHTLTLASGTGGGIFLQNPIIGPGSLVMAAGDVFLFADTGVSNVPVAIQGAQVFAGTGLNVGPAWQMSAGKLRLGTTQIPGLSMTGGTLDLSMQASATIASNLTLAPASSVLAQFDSPTNILLTVAGQVNLASARLTVGFADLVLLGTPLKLIQKASPGAVTGTFASLPEGGLLSATNDSSGLITLYRISYAGGDGNDIMLTPIPPAPSGFTRTWNGAGADALWPTAANWTGNTPPATGDTAIFPVNAARRVNTNTSPGLVLNAIEWRGSNYVHSGTLSLLSGLRHGAAGGTNTFNGALLATYGEQNWAVSNAAATLSIAPDLVALGGDRGAIEGLGPVTKTGTGTLDLNNVTFRVAGGLVINGGTVRLTDMDFNNHSSLLLQQGRIEATGVSAESTIATNGELSLFFEPNDDDGLSGGLSSFGGITFGSNLTVTVHWTNGAFASLHGSQLDLGNAHLNITFPPSLPAGETILVAQYALDELTGQFASLPEGAVTNFSGRDWEIHYAVEIPEEQSDTRFITLSLPAIAPRFTSIERLSSGDVILRGTAGPGATVSIEASKIVEAFVFIGSTVANAAGQFTFIDTAGAFAQRFYRAAIPAP